MDFKDKLREIAAYPLNSLDLKILQVNMGSRCNMSCRHCHVLGGPASGEVMDRRTVESILDVLRSSDVQTLDITGGAPEMNPHFRLLVEGASKAGKHVTARTNLTVFFEEGMDYLPELYFDNGVEVTASLPCYLEDNVDRVRGDGAFGKSLRALEMLNNLGYGRGDANGRLNLVFNPAGAALPPDQAALEADYKKALASFDITFDRLFTFANMPIGRFREYLARSGDLDKYMGGLKDVFNPCTVDGLMCRHLISVGWDGALYDCDFNLALGLGVNSGAPRHIKDFDYGRLADREIEVGEHCYGCTASRGST